MTPRAHRVVEKRQQRETERFARLDAEDTADRRQHPRPGWYPPTKAREYTGDDDAQPAPIESTE